eukprot:8605455-Pyramimonas_sp.AAC.1
MDVGGVLEEVMLDVHAQLWSRASEHEGAEGLAGGADLYWARREFLKFSHIGGYDQAGQTLCVAAGALCPRVRQLPTGTGEQQRCPRCLKAAETLRRRVWECD